MGIATGALLGIGNADPLLLRMAASPGGRLLHSVSRTAASRFVGHDARRVRRFVTPWLVRNYNLSGVPFGTATYAIYQETTPQFKGNKLERYLSRDFDLALAKVEVEQFLKKLMVNSAEIVRA